jgi:hypothetical protein
MHPNPNPNHAWCMSLVQAPLRADPARHAPAIPPSAATSAAEALLAGVREGAGDSTPLVAASAPTWQLVPEGCSDGAMPHGAPLEGEVMGSGGGAGGDRAAEALLEVAAALEAAAAELKEGGGRKGKRPASWLPTAFDRAMRLATGSSGDEPPAGLSGGAGQRPYSTAGEGSGSVDDAELALAAEGKDVGRECTGGAGRSMELGLSAFGLEAQRAEAGWLGGGEGGRGGVGDDDDVGDDVMGEGEWPSEGYLEAYSAVVGEVMELLTTAASMHSKAGAARGAQGAGGKAGRKKKGGTPAPPATASFPFAVGRGIEGLEGIPGLSGLSMHVMLPPVVTKGCADKATSILIMEAEMRGKVRVENFVLFLNQESTTGAYLHAHDVNIVYKHQGPLTSLIRCVL